MASSDGARRVEDKEKIAPSAAPASRMSVVSCSKNNVQTAFQAHRAGSGATRFILPSMIWGLRLTSLIGRSRK